MRSGLLLLACALPVLLWPAASALALDDLNRPRVYELRPGVQWPPLYEVRPGMTGCGRDRPCEWQEPERDYNSYTQPQTDYDLAVPMERPVDPLPRGGRLNPQRDIIRSHRAWCLDRYRSYDRRNDTFQPYYGARRRCISPYVRVD
jgi:hypothetical protein